MNLEIVAISALAGLGVSVSPCQLPIYPILINMMVGKGTDRKMVSAAFAAGHALMYGLVYLGLALAIRAIGIDRFDAMTAPLYRGAYAIGGLICVAFAAQVLGKIRLFERTIGAAKSIGAGIPGAFATGALFATVVSPCNLPFLIALFLPLLSMSSTIFEGLLGIAVFAAFLSLPILLLGLSADLALGRVFRDRMRILERASALVLVALGAYFLWLAALI